ncbi:hypothetical protein UT300005_09770 [Clostridium sp. CTA-5]
MRSNFINKQILRSSILKLLLYILCITFLGFLANLLMPQFKLMVNPVITISNYSDIELQNSKSDKNIITFNANKNNITKIGDKVSPEGELQAVYATIVMNDKAVLISAPMKFFQNDLNNDSWKFKGVVHPISENSNEMLRNIKATNTNSQDIIKQLQPLMVNCEDNYGYESNIESAIVFLILLAVILLVILWIIATIINPKLNYTNRLLSKHGDIKLLKDNIDKELNDNIKLKVSKIFITENWFIYNGTFKVIALPIKNIVWVHKFIRKQLISNYSVRIYTSVNQECETYLLTEKMVDKIINYFSDSFPWMIIGFDEKIKEQWDSKPEELIESISFNKKRYENTDI